MNQPITDLNAAFGKALLDQFFAPIPMGVSPDGRMYHAPSGLAVLAQEIHKQHATEMRDEVWKKIDLDALAGKVADLVVAELTRKPGAYEARNVHQENLSKRVLEIVAQQLGQRVVDQMDLQIGPKSLAHLDGEPTHDRERQEA